VLYSLQVRATSPALHHVLAIVLGLAWAVTPTAVPRAQQQTPAAPTAVFRTGVDLLVVEATVVGKGGDAARDLGATDFKAKIGDRPRDVVSAEFVEYEDATSASADADLTTNEERPSRTVLLVVDQSSLAFDRRGALQGAKKWLATLAPTDRLGFLGLPAPGPMVEFTTDHTKVQAAFAALKTGVAPMPAPYFGRNVSLWEAFQIVEHNDAALAAAVARECRQRDPTCRTEVVENARATAQDSAERVQPVLQALERVFLGLRALPGPKHVVLVSSGWPMEERFATAAVSALAAAASLANVTVHVFTQEEWAQAASSLMISPMRTLDQNLMLQSVETLAGYTGGRAVRLSGNGEAAFTSLNRSLTGYYRVALRPEDEDLDGRTKRISLDLTRGGLSLIGYRHVMAGTRPRVAATPATGAADGVHCKAAIVDALKNDARQTALGLRATSYVMRGDAPDSMRVAVIGDVTRAAEGTARAVSVLFDQGGRPAPGTEQDVRIPAEGRGRVMTTLSVAPGQYVLRVVVCDDEGRVGSLERPVDARWHDTEGTAFTGLVLFRAVGGAGGALEPVLDVVSTGDQIVAQLPLSGPLARAGASVAYEVTSDDAAAYSPVRLVGRAGTTSTGALVDQVVIAAGTLVPGHYTIAASIEPGTPPISRRSFRVEAPPAR
jgi:VWFA-related protein